MKERGILFSAPMVRALLDGTKTQTRRALQSPESITSYRHFEGIRWDRMEGSVRGDSINCRYGQPGDRLWVRETHWWFKDEVDHETGYFPPKLTSEDVQYRADGDDGRKVWRPSIFMPRWASRITLEVTEVRVERLQDISESDAMAEGGEPVLVPPDGGSWPYYEGYRVLWESINGPGSWALNPWVWVVEFRVLPSVVPRALVTEGLEGHAATNHPLNIK